MTDLDALLAGIVADPHNHLRWLILADWLDDHEQPDRAELLRLHRMLIDTCCEPDQHPERAEWQRRMVELIDLGVKPCVPQHTLTLPGSVPLVANFIPPGSFLMGSEEEENEKPVRTASIPNGFFMGATAITQAQWEAVVGRGPSTFRGDNRPVENVDWDSATAFCRRVRLLRGQSVRLPTEAEWEYACRAGTSTHSHYGDVPSTARMNCDGSVGWGGATAGESRGQSTEVGSFASNPWGLFDCHGNVWEWCQHWFPVGDPPTSPDLDPTDQHNVTRENRSLRGGSWFQTPQGCRAASRYTPYPARRGVIGFRVTFTLS